MQGPMVATESRPYEGARRMRISRLELHGFKSFADRSVFHFGEGISCVVGPNGCGKSNVVDSLKWVIGEQSAKSLRGGEMQDVIFAGSAERKPVGYAEVGLTFTSEGGEPFPGEYVRYKEIQIARRLYRSGASEYLINQTRVRRKDIVDLLMDSGVGNNLYSFIEQGRIGKIVAASPHERRSLIDEAAGITRYKQRRKEARAKLEATSSQLDRAADVAEEMGRRLKQLERQVLKAARFRRLRALVRQEECFLSMVKYLDNAEALQTLHEQVTTLTRQVADEEEGVDRLEDDLDVRTGEVSVCEGAVDVAREALAEVDAQRREVEATTALHRQRADELRKQLDEARGELAADEERVRVTEEERDDSASILSRIGDRIAEAEAAASTFESELRTAESQRDAARDSLRSTELEAGQLEERLQELRGRRTTLQARNEELPARQARVEARLETAADEATVLLKRKQVAEEVLLERRERLRVLGEEIAVAETEVDAKVRAEVHARDALAHADGEHAVAQTALDEAVAEAEATAGLADEQVAARVGVVQQREDNQLRQADRQDADHIAGLEADERRLMSRAEGRARTWIAAWSAQEDAAVAALRREVEQAREAEDARRQREIDGLAGALSAELDRVEAEHRAALDTRLGELRTRRDAAEARLEAGRQQQNDAEGRRALVVRNQRAAEGRLAALRAEDEAVRNRDAGARAVATVLPDAPALVDVLDLDEAGQAAAVPLLGDRMWMRVVRSPEEAAVAAEAARQAGPTSVVHLAGGGLDEVLKGVHRAESLSEAVAHHAATGGAAVVVSTGERVAVDGVISLGTRGDDVRSALDRRDEIERLEGELTAAAGQLSEIDTDIVAAKAAIEGARLMVRKTGEQMDAVEREGREAMRAELARLRKDGETELAESRRSRQTWRSEARAADEQRVAARVALRDQGAASLRGEADQVLADLRTASDARLDEARAAVASRRDARVVESQARVDAARAEAWEVVRKTTADIQVRRDELRATLTTCRDALDRARNRVARAGERLAEARAAREALAAKRSEHELVIVRMEGEASSAVEQAAALEERTSALEEEKRTLVDLIAEARQGLSDVVARLGELEQLGGDVGGRLSSARDRFETYELGAMEAREAWEGARASASELRERRGRAEATHAAALRQLETAGERQATVRRRMVELQVTYDEACGAEEEAGYRLEELAEERQKASTKHEGVRERLKQLKEARARVEAESRAVAAALAEHRHALVTAEQRQHQTQAAQEELVLRMDERYQLDLPTLTRQLIERDAIRLDVSEEVAQGVQIAGKTVEPVEPFILRREMLDDEETIRDFVERIEEHRAKLARIGDVNLTALEEYTELAERFEDLDGQRLDLDESVQSIRTAIAKMNRTCRERFRETFDRVDEAFRKAYPELVGGGEARLELTDEEDLLETGVEIYVRPPGKRLQNLGLLSGGEKAMTAIALLLALFTVKPSPFCVLDEVDAPLDEANGARFNEMIRHMSSLTQFIVITHNRKTMECADTLYGITMPTPGCSSLVSVQIDA